MRNNVAIKLYIIHTGSTNWILDKFTVATTLAAIRTTVLVSKYFGKSLFFTLLKTCMFHTWTFIKKKLYLCCPWTSYDDNDNPVYFFLLLNHLGGTKNDNSQKIFRTTFCTQANRTWVFKSRTLSYSTITLKIYIDLFNLSRF